MSAERGEDDIPSGIPGVRWRKSTSYDGMVYWDRSMFDNHDMEMPQIFKKLSVLGRRKLTFEPIFDLERSRRLQR